IPRESGSERAQDPVQEWGEEEVDGAVFGITLRREPVLPASDTAELPAAFGFVQYHTVKVRRLKAASLERLVTHLLDTERREPDFVPVFLSTYRSFTSTSTLIELLPPLISADITLNFSGRLLSTLAPVIRLWLKEYSEDLNEPPQYQNLRLLYAHLRHRLCFRRLSQTADTLLKRLQEQGGYMLFTVWTPGCSVSFGSISKLLSVPLWVFTFTLCLPQELFVKVVPFHCLGCVWSQRDKKENRNLAPTVRATISQFNAVTNRVITSLLCLSAPDPATSSAQVIERWIAIAQECRQLKNFSSLRAILSALQSNAVYRLKKTWAAVSRESTTIFDHLCETFPDENCVLTSREILVEASTCTQELSKYYCDHYIGIIKLHSGVVPYLGTYLTVLNMLDTALTDTMEEFEILSQIRQLQASCSQYSLPVHPHITAWLQAHTLLTDQESYELSRDLEPPVDPCPSSPNSWSRRSLHNVAEDFSSMSPTCPRLSRSSSSSSNPDLSSSSLVLNPDSSLLSRCSGRDPTCGRLFRLQLTSQDHTPKVIRRALEKHNMEHVSCHDFSLCQMLNNGKEFQIPDKANVFYAMCTTANYDFVLRQRWRSHERRFGSSSSPGAHPKSRQAK
uniref:Uncharacterized protein n=1 Tax=Mola mola TaxID=94237 RepID=A0A3Q3WL26_MOLML